MPSSPWQQSSKRLSPSQKHCHSRNAPLKLEGKTPQCSHNQYHLQCSWSILAACCSCCTQSKTLSSFSTLMLLVGHQTRYPAWESSATTFPRRILLFRTSLTSSNLTGNDSAKKGQLNINQCVRMSRQQYTTSTLALWSLVTSRQCWVQKRVVAGNSNS